MHDVSCGPKRFITAPQEIADFVALRLCASDATVASGVSDATGATEPDDWTGLNGVTDDTERPTIRPNRMDAQNAAQPDQAGR